MRKFLNIFFALFAIVSLMACASQKQDLSSLYRKWMLVEFKNYSKEILIKNQANIDLSATKSEKNQYSAFAGCNRMFLTAEFKPDGTVAFSHVGSTMMYCDKAMDLEEFAKSLPTMTSYKIEGHNLILSDGKGNTMKFLAEDWD